MSLLKVQKVAQLPLKLSLCFTVVLSIQTDSKKDGNLEGNYAKQALNLFYVEFHIHSGWISLHCSKATACV